jgi:pyruvate formate lyase activating enzyme
MKVDEIVSLAAKDKPFYRKTGGGVTISGGEPFANIDFLIELLKGLKVERIHTAIETTGYTSWDNICRSLEFTDLLLYDLKHTDSHKHEVYTGVKNEIILENLKMLDTTGCEYWVRVPIIPTFNDDMRTLSSIFDFISCLNNIKKAELLPYHRLGVGKYAQLGMEYKFDRINTNSTAFLVEMKDYLIHKYPDIKISIHE